MKSVLPIGRVLFPGVDAKGLRKLESLARSWLPKKTADACCVRVGGESEETDYNVIKTLSDMCAHTQTAYRSFQHPMFI